MGLQSGLLQGLAELHNPLPHLQHPEVHGIPWYLQAAITPDYVQSALSPLCDVAAAHLEQQLVLAVQLPSNNPQLSRLAKVAYGLLRL